MAVYLSRVEGATGRKVLVLFTDGEDSRSELSFSDAAQLLRSSRVTVYPIAFSSFAPGSTRAVKARAVLQHFADLTGGTVFHPSSSRDLAGIYQKILDELQGQYVLGYVSDNRKTDGKMRRVSVEVSNRPELRLRHRPGYQAPSPGTGLTSPSARHEQRMIEGTLDRTIGSTLNGWAWDSARPHEPVVVDIYDHDDRTLLASVTADRPAWTWCARARATGATPSRWTCGPSPGSGVHGRGPRLGHDRAAARSPLAVELEDWEARAPRLKGRFCSVPFEKLALSNDGARLCCPSYVPTVVGDPKTQTLDEIWNSPAAIEIRRSIVDGDYRYCLDLCPAIVQDVLPRVETLPPRRLRGRGGGGEGPDAHRPQAPGAAARPLVQPLLPVLPRDHHRRHRAGAGGVPGHPRPRHPPRVPSLRILEFAGGEILASAHLKNVALSIDKEAAPDLRVAIMSNGTLFDREAWEQLRNIHGIVKLVYVSLDAAAADSFQELRRGGIWPETLANVEFLSTLRRDGLIEEFGITFVVQQRNYREMRAFAELGLRLGCDRVMFHELVDFGTYAEGGYAVRNVCDPAHPEHQQLLAVLPIRSSPSGASSCTALHGLRRQALAQEAAAV